jgi:hypothetical protein
MESFPGNQFGRFWRKANQWFYRTADRALDEAYKAALKIKAIEDEHFGGEKIAIASEYNGSQVATYFQNDLNKYLNIARIRLVEFQTSRTVTGNNYPRSLDGQQFDPSFSSINSYTQDIEQEARILEKLRQMLISKRSSGNNRLTRSYHRVMVDRSHSILQGRGFANETIQPDSLIVFPPQ